MLSICDRVSSKTSETTILNQELNFGGVRRLVGGTNHPNASTTAQRGKREQQTRILSNVRYAVFLSSYCSDCWEFEVNGSAEVQMQAEVSFFFFCPTSRLTTSIHSLQGRHPRQPTFTFLSLVRSSKSRCFREILLWITASEEVTRPSPSTSQSNSSTTRSHVSGPPSYLPSRY
jgi:hypothetical protein